MGSASPGLSVEDACGGQDGRALGTLPYSAAGRAACQDIGGCSRHAAVADPGPSSRGSGPSALLAAYTLSKRQLSCTPWLPLDDYRLQTGH